MKTLVIVDGQNDFISGSLACQEALEAMKRLVNFIESHPEIQVVYTADWHKPTNQSFQVNGGIWPVHCVEGTEGACLYQRFYDLSREASRPNKANLFKKGKNDDVEEYSGCKGVNELGKTLEESLQGEIYVAGLASEYCVRETLLGLAKKGLDVKLYLPGVGYVNKEDHMKNLEDLKGQGFTLLEE